MASPEAEDSHRIELHPALAHKNDVKESADVRFGSFLMSAFSLNDVRFTPKSGHLVAVGMSAKCQ